MRDVCLIFTDSMVDFADRHNTRAAVQRRCKVRRRLDPVRHEKHKKYHRDYMKKWQAVGGAYFSSSKQVIAMCSVVSIFSHIKSHSL